MTMRKAPDRQCAGADREPPSRPRLVGRVLLVAGSAQVIALFVNGLCRLVAARLITVAVGIDQFGVVMLVATLGQLLSFADFGVGAAVANARAQVGDTPSGAQRFRKTTLTAIRTTLGSASLVVFVAVSFGLLGVWPTLLGAHDSQLRAALNIAAVVALAAFAVALPFKVGEAALRGGGRLYQAPLILGLSGPAALIITVVLYMLDAPPLTYALPIPLGLLLAAVCCGIRAFRLDNSILGGVVEEVVRPRRYPGLAISATAAPYFVAMVGLPLALQSDQIVLAHRVGPAILSDYTYVAQLYTPLWSIVCLAAGALWPHFAANNQGRGAIRKYWLTGMAYLSAAGFIIAAGFLLLSRYVVHWMSAGRSTPEWSLLLAFAALLVVQSVHITTGIMLIAPRQLRFQAVCVVALVLTNLPLSWMLAPQLGAAGPVIASAITVAACQLVPGLIIANRATSTGSLVRLPLREEPTDGNRTTSGI
jgi:O-antigen/teichoic acid export membrane protein